MTEQNARDVCFFCYGRTFHLSREQAVIVDTVSTGIDRYWGICRYHCDRNEKEISLGIHGMVFAMQVQIVGVVV